MHLRNLLFASLYALVACLAPCCRARDGARPDPALLALTLTGLDGQRYQPLALAEDECHVLVFLSHECPIANAYAPTLRSLHSDWAKDAGPRLFLIHVDPDLDLGTARQHALDYGLPGTVLLDPEHLLVRAVVASTTPEAVVWTLRGIAYQGRIDDQWRQLGSRAPVARRHDLANAVALVQAGKAVPRPHAKAIGCAIPDLVH